ncbi:MAG: UDP-3-O-(3-hydroxymyristoyl)glucosamine N-acyltransferase [Gammaproteobacteria bacterium]|nr:UDP-3-O-(3-hydroxymyristoyl)glucosamine N-acyltransferase [Gammaproteobacteria bacterium]
MAYTVAQIADILKAEFHGDPETPLLGLSPIDEIQANHLIFADGENYLKIAFESCAAAVIVTEIPEHATKPVILCKNPLMAIAELLPLFYPPIEKEAKVHPTAYIGQNVTIGKNVYVGPYAVIEDNSSIGQGCEIHAHAVIGDACEIGDNCIIHPHVTLYPFCKLDHHVMIHSGSVIGSDGFGYRQINGIHQKLPHVGHVVIDSHVEIGANTVIDRATLGTTRIGKGTKIDNLVQIAHSVKLGEHNILCAFTGIAGSSTSGNHVLFAANVGVSDHVKIEDQVILGARAGVPPKKVLKQGQMYLGNPARPKDKAIEQEFSTTRIPFMRKHIQTLQDKVQQLEQQIQQITTEIE